MKNSSLQTLQAYKVSVQKALDELKQNNASVDEIDALSIHLADVDDVIDVKLAKVKTEQKPVDNENAVTTQEVADKSTATAQETANKNVATARETASKNTVVLQIHRGKRFNQTTGKEESIPYVQTFTRAEAILFAKNYKQLGYSIVKVISNPFSDSINF